MSKAWIDGVPAPFGDAVRGAAERLASSRLPLVTGLHTDVAGIKAALALARAAGGVVDHAGSEALYRDLAVLRGSGLFLGAPAEMRRRADRFLLVGDVPASASDFLGFVFGGRHDLGRGSEAGRERKIVWLRGEEADLPAGGIGIEAIAVDASALSNVVGMIRASLGGRRFGAGPVAAEKADEIGKWLAGAGFACILWSAATLDRMTVEMLAGLVADLNLTTRATALPLHEPGDAYGAAEVAAWSSGYPLRTSFAGGGAEHDPWVYAGTRLAQSGECDFVVHVSALAGIEAGEPRGLGELPAIAVSAGLPRWRRPPAIAFEVGLPGRHHDGVLYEPKAASFVPTTGGAGTAAPSAASVLSAITGALIKARSPERAA